MIPPGYTIKDRGGSYAVHHEFYGPLEYGFPSYGDANFGAEQHAEEEAEREAAEAAAKALAEAEYDAEPDVATPARREAA